MHTIKHLATSIIILLSLYSCNIGRGTHGTNGYHITGEIKNCTAKTVFLDELSTEGFSTIDTVTIDSKGGFSFKGNTKEPLFCALRFDANMPAEKRVFIVVDSNAKIKLEADYNIIENYDIKGSEDCKLIQQLLGINKIMEDKLKVLDTKFAGYDPKKVSDSVTKIIRGEYQDIITEQETSIDKFITSNDGITNYFAALFMMQAPPLELLQKIDTKGMKRYATSKYAVILNEFLTKKQVAGIGTLAPDINLNDVNGVPLKLSSLRGQYVLIDFWASWCGPCRRENPANVELYNKYHSKGFEIYGVSLDDTKSKWVNAIQSDKLTWKHVSDLAGWGSSAAKMYNVTSIPHTFLVDQEGKIIASDLRSESLRIKLEEIFGK